MKWYETCEGEFVNLDNVLSIKADSLPGNENEWGILANVNSSDSGEAWICIALEKGLKTKQEADKRLKYIMGYIMEDEK